jgi:hypothetical protein
MKPSKLNRLPGLDMGTRRSETAAFATLGLACGAVILFAGWRGLQFKVHSDCILEALSPDPGAQTIRTIGLDTNLAAAGRMQNGIHGGITNGRPAQPGPRS